MMHQYLYQLMYWLGLSRWDSGVTPPEVEEAFRIGDIPPGAALDLGCGTGTNVIFMAKHGRQAIGIDFVPGVIKKARDKARQAGVSELTRFHVADVTRLEKLQLPVCAYALDMGCFHGLSPEGRLLYTERLANILVPGGKYMLYTHDPRNKVGVSTGILPESVKELFVPWFDITRIERGTFRNYQSSWFWMERK